jgi:hypothetical protein
VNTVTGVCGRCGARISGGATREVCPACVPESGLGLLGDEDEDPISHARIRGEIRTKSVKVRGTVEGNIFVTERCELHAGCTLRGDIEAPGWWLMTT